MAVKYGKFELPTKIKIEKTDKENSFNRFVAEPFERGFGHTVGNALRRIMLTSLEAPSIISIKIEGVSHEYMAVEGIIEDMTHVILNIKNALLRMIPTEESGESRSPRIVTNTLEVSQEMLDQNKGHYSVTLKDLIGDTSYDVVNPELHIFTATKPMIRKIDFKIAIGRGYVPSERHVVSDKVVDEIIIDSAFSPVRLVNYFVENTRVGQDTDYDRLVLEVTTDGRVTPEEALTFATQIGVEHLKVFDELSYQPITFELKEKEQDTDRDKLLGKLGLKINEIELSVRSTNCLVQANIDTIAELVIMPESEMLKFRNFGKKSLNEIKAKLDEMSLYLGMDLSKYSLTRENVKQKMVELNDEKLGKEE
ncbi:MAG: DNA-directed RNA polymerase subunit alpha [Simkaniaceae bacterium]|nr:DNA-directed RNA polymerase subunit alpha [Simkaniaceae bacterium]